MTLPAIRPCSVCHEPTRSYGPGMVVRDAETDAPHWCPVLTVPYWQLCALCDDLKQSDQPHVCYQESQEVALPSAAAAPASEDTLRVRGLQSLL